MDAANQGLLAQFYRHWARVKQSLGLDPESRLESINPNTEVVVPKEVLTEAHQNRIQLANIENALSKKIEECNKIREHWQALVGELSDLKSSKQVFVVDDVEMTAKWQQLQYSIRNFAKTYLRNVISPESLTGEQKHLLKLTGPFYREFLSTPGQMHLLFQSLMWLYVTETILVKPHVVWGKDTFAAVETLTKACSDRGEDYQAWRAQTGEILQKQKGISGKTEVVLKEDLFHMMEQFIPREAIHDEHVKIMYRSMGKIVDKAIELAVMFNQSRCIYRCKAVPIGWRFDPEIMDDDEECSTPQVDLMVSPVLVKYGNSRGQNYDQHLILAKSHVRCLMQTMQEKERNDDNCDGGRESDRSQGEILVEI
ncbi:hypothetical protein GGR51DRAFT_568512 [Nemania sp. FL0031]|nr:hypothetical protein GGR51DRAFT_568512 [Nemania sp. FL0031]